MKLLRLLMLFLFSGLFIMGCEDELEELNDNPNEPEEVSPAVLMTAASRNSMNSMVTESFLLANNIAQITAKTLRAEVDVYNWNAFTTLWQNQYRALADFEDAEIKALEEGDSATAGASIIMQSWIYYTLTMAYGDIPYKEANGGVKGTENFTPVYNTQEEVLDGNGGLLDELQRAEDYLDGNDVVTGDLIYSGDASKWQKLANALQLRILLHVDNQRDVSADMQALVNSGNLMADNSDNAVLDYPGQFPNEYPLFPLKQGDFDAVVMSEASVEFMDSLGDPRLGRYARPQNIDSLGTPDDTAAFYRGANNGSEDASTCNKGGSRLGLSYYDYPGQPSLDASQRADGIIMTYAEQQLILAEASQKGLIGGPTEPYYRDGIEASMTYHGVDVASFGWTDFADFYNNSGVSDRVDLLQIWEQKWLATFFHGMEPFFEVRRMVYEQNSGGALQVNAVPFLNAPCQNVNGGELPVRFLYPGNEQTLNSENYDEAVGRLDQGNSQNSRIWIISQ